ncbi:hypothetical protein Dac01nite_14920 [Demequina activiva]|uniref:L,D-TPase catalytic domain-containing protein n=1 Tax=Demequina activiva TaxID=1582364 RepID=A0A919Q6J4_9MICO|nr:hypothetical protein Dac01nite_14920 [Demequina activiva]
MAVAAVAVAGTVLAIALSGGDPAAPATAAEPTSAMPAPSAHSAAPSPSPSATAGVAPGEIVVTTTGEPIQLYARAGDAEPSEQLEEWSLYGSPTTLLGFDTQDVDGSTWIAVELVGAPNHRRAWVREADVEVTATDVAIHVYLDEREVDLTRAGEVELTTRAVIGADESPTPVGTFWVTDPLDFSANDSGVYGAYALGLNGFSETLEEFNGGPPQIAVHGTNQPELLGENVSNGCIRVPNDVAIELGAQAPVGTPVIVHQSRAA